MLVDDSVIGGKSSLGSGVPVEHGLRGPLYDQSSASSHEVVMHAAATIATIPQTIRAARVLMSEV
jgi:hypothetical protein